MLWIENGALYRYEINLLDASNKLAARVTVDDKNQVASIDIYDDNGKIIETLYGRDARAKEYEWVLDTYPLIFQ